VTSRSVSLVVTLALLIVCLSTILATAKPRNVDDTVPRLTQELDRVIDLADRCVREGVRQVRQSRTLQELNEALGETNHAVSELAREATRLCRKLHALTKATYRIHLDWVEVRNNHLDVSVQVDPIHILSSGT